MKRTVSFSTRMFGLFAALLLPVCTTLAQPAWPPNAATVADYIDMFSTNNTVGANKRINIDMFSHYVNSSSSFYPDDEVVAVAFDDVNAGEVRLMVWDVSANIWDTEIIPGATQPDVILLDHPGAFMGQDYYVALVYEQAGDVKIRYYTITGVNTVSFDLQSAGNIHTLNTAPFADNPHIDAAPTTTTFVPTSGWGPGMALHAFTKFAVTWHQGNEIWTGVDNNFAVNNVNTTVTNKMKVDDGLVSDVAFALIQDNSIPATYYKAYYIYDKGNDIRYAEVTDPYSPSMPTLGPWSAPGIVVSPPRIDCGHFGSWGGSGQDHWQAVVGMQNGGLNEIHSYGFTGGTVTTTNFSAPGFIQPSWPTNPLASNNAHYPTVAAASFCPAWNVGAAFAGNTDYMMGFLFDYPSPYPVDHFMAVTQGGPILTTQMGYDEVDMGGVSVGTLTSGGNEPALALSFGTNSGYGNTAAFSDGSTVYVKKPKNYMAPAPPMFKTTDIVKVPISRGLSVYPNPATTQVSISGLAEGTRYAITDVVGKQYTEGTMNKTSKTINISSFPAGIYIVSAGSGNAVKHIKFVKE